MYPIETSHASLMDGLSAEHAALLPEIEMLMKLATTNAAALHAALDRIAAHIGSALDAHIAQEDKLLFPAYAEAEGDSGLIDLFGAEHREILRLRDELLAAHRDGGDTDSLASMALRLGDLLVTHMAREDMMLFPTMRSALD